MEVCFLSSGETLTVLDDELQGKTGKAVKKALAAKVGISRFQQRLFVEDGSHEIQDDEIADPAPLKIQLVVLEFWPTDDEETQKFSRHLGTTTWLLLNSCCSSHEIPMRQAQMARHPFITLQGKDMFNLWDCYWRQEQR